MRRHGGAPEVVPTDIEGGDFGSGKLTSLSRVPPPIQPFQMPQSSTRSRRAGISVGGIAAPGSSTSLDAEGIKNTGVLVGVIWIGGCLLLGYELLWPVYLVLNIIYSVLSIPPFSWILGWVYRGAPLVAGGVAEELQLAPNQVSNFVDSYVHQFGDAALIFAAHDGYPQVLKGLLYHEELGYKALINARDDAGNTALIYAAAKGFRQCTSALLRNGANPDEANEGNGGRTALMEAAGGGFRDIVTSLRLAANMTSIDKQDDYGNTALHYAAYHGHLSIVLDLLKSEPNKDVKNSYGHTPASYALANKHKGVADLLNRPQSRSPTRTKEVDKRDDALNMMLSDSAKLSDNIEEQLKKIKVVTEEKHVKGSAEELHKKDKDFAPMSESGKIGDAEQKALEEQLAKLKRAQDESELKFQKRIVELLEKNAAHQTALDKAQEERRAISLNNTEMAFKIKELESKSRSSDLRVHEEADRAKSLTEENQNMKLEADRHRSRAEAAERDRDHYKQASQRHEDNYRQVLEEVRQHQERYAQQQKEVASLRERLEKSEADSRRRQDEIDQLQRQLREAGLPSAGRSQNAEATAETMGRDTQPAVGSSEVEAVSDQATNSSGSTTSEQRLLVHAEEV